MSLATVTLHDPSGSRAEILVGFGFNCFRFTAMRAGQPWEVLWSHPEFASGTQRPSGSGIPILFPFPGRLRGTQFAWEGREFTLPEGDGRGNAIHGFVHRRPWRVVEQSDRRVVGEFHAEVDDPALLSQWPADFRVRCEYELRGNTLVGRFRIDNPGTTPLPFGFGTHPYFRLPAGGGARCVLTAPVTRRWELLDMQPTGRQIELGSDCPLADGVTLGDRRFDDVYTGIRGDGPTWSTLVHDPVSGLRVKQTVERLFRECVVYVPPHREAVCLEPYSFLPDAFRWQAQFDAGLRVLAPGESLTTDIVIEVE